MVLFESSVLDHIEERRSPLFVKRFLHGASFIYKAALFLRNKAYDFKWKKVVKAPLPVISIGNIVAGGTGKTPFVRLLVEQLSGKKIAILSRGYRSKIEKEKSVDFVTADSSTEEFGDEPIWYAKALPQVIVGVGINRVRSAELAKKRGAELAILDDGMQHRRLHRDLEIVIMDGQDLFGKGYFLPRGYLRDFPSRLSKADLIAVNHVENLAHFEKCKEILKKYTSCPIIGMNMQIQENQISPKTPVGVFCGIGRPERFLDTIEKMGLPIKARLISLDHMPIKKEELEEFSQRCEKIGAKALVCTEKDYVKIPQDLASSLPIVPLKADLKILFGEEHFKELIEKIKTKL